MYKDFITISSRRRFRNTCQTQFNALGWLMKKDEFSRPMQWQTGASDDIHSLCLVSFAFMNMNFEEVVFPPIYVRRFFYHLRFSN